MCRPPLTAKSWSLRRELVKVYQWRWEWHVIDVNITSIRCSNETLIVNLKGKRPLRDISGHSSFWYNYQKSVTRNVFATKTFYSQWVSTRRNLSLWLYLIDGKYVPQRDCISLCRQKRNPIYEAFVHQTKKYLSLCRYL